MKNSALSGSAHAQFLLGSCYDFGCDVGQDTTEAVRYYKMAADQGHIDAQFSLGLHYTLSSEDRLAEAYYRVAADKGHVRAQYNLGLCYFHGNGVNKDH